MGDLEVIVARAGWLSAREEGGGREEKERCAAPLGCLHRTRTRAHRGVGDVLMGDLEPDGAAYIHIYVR